jgi:hypothetical protein
MKGEFAAKIFFAARRHNLSARLFGGGGRERYFYHYDYKEHF